MLSIIAMSSVYKNLKYFYSTLFSHSQLIKRNKFWESVDSKFDKAVTIFGLMERGIVGHLYDTVANIS